MRSFIFSQLLVIYLDERGKYMIRLYNNYYISADANNFTLKKTLINKSKATGEEYEKMMTVGYFASLNSLYSHFIREVEKDVLMDENVKTLADFISGMDSIIAELTYTINSFANLSNRDKYSKEGVDGIKEVLRNDLEEGEAEE